MTVKKGYNRFFIIFQEEDKGFGVAIDKQPTGYTKIESRNGKCKITVYVQNLVKEKGPYVCCLLDTTKNPVIYARMGEISVDETGRGETWWEYKEEDIAETGISADRFNAAAVVLEGTNVLAPLAGYVGKDRQSWKDRLPLNKRSLKVEDEEKQEVEELDEEAIKFNEYEQRIKQQESKVEEKLDHEGMTAFIDNPEIESIEENVEMIQEVDNKKEEVEEKEEEIYEVSGSAGMNRVIDDDISDDIEETDNVDETASIDDRHKKKKTHASMFIEILKNYEEVENISTENKGCRWWKVPYNNEMPIRDKKYYPYYCAVHHLKMTYPYLNYIKYFKKCGYFYFGMRIGRDGEIKFLMYGIEGTMNPQEQPYMGMTGFTKWMPLSNKNIGMWVMYYNPYSGCIMIPKSESKMKMDND